MIAAPIPRFQLPSATAIGGSSAVFEWFGGRDGASVISPNIVTHIFPNHGLRYIQSFCSWLSFLSTLLAIGFLNGTDGVAHDTVVLADLAAPVGMVFAIHFEVAYG